MISYFFPQPWTVATRQGLQFVGGSVQPTGRDVVYRSVFLRVTHLSLILALVSQIPPLVLQSTGLVRKIPPALSLCTNLQQTPASEDYKEYPCNPARTLAFFNVPERITQSYLEFDNPQVTHSTVNLAICTQTGSGNLNPKT